MSDEQAAELKGCPFCGGTNILAEYDGDGQAWHVCRSCAAEGPVVHKRGDEYDPDWNTRPIEDALSAENERLRAENASLKDANNIDLGEKAPLIFENTELRAKVSELTRQLSDSDQSITNLLREREQNLTRIIELTRLLGEAEEAIREAADETGGEPEFSDERCSYETIQVGYGWRKEWRESAPVQRALKGVSS